VANYTYVARDILTRNVLAELPLRGVEFGESITDGGYLTGSLPIAGLPARARSQMDTATQEGRTALWVYRDARLMWGGPIWLRPYDSGAYKITAEGWRSWFARQPLDEDKSYVATDVFDIIRDLVTWAQVGAGRPPQAYVWVALPGTMSEVTIDATFLGNDLKTVDTIIQELADAIGFEWTVSAWDAALSDPIGLLELGSPRLGRTADVSGHVWERTNQAESSIVALSWPGDGRQLATRVIGVGGATASGGVPIRSTATNTTLLDQGYPLICSTVSRTDVTVQDNLDDIVNAELLSRSSALVDPTITVLADSYPTFGDWRIGDDCRVRVVGDPRWPDGLDTYARIIGYRAHPRPGAETVDLILAPMLEGAPRLVRRSRTYGRQMSDVEKRLLLLEARRG
jgi:hypothetical protein